MCLAVCPHIIDVLYHFCVVRTSLKCNLITMITLCCSFSVRLRPRTTEHNALINMSTPRCSFL